MKSFVILIWPSHPPSPRKGLEIDAIISPAEVLAWQVSSVALKGVLESIRQSALILTGVGSTAPQDDDLSVFRRCQTLLFERTSPQTLELQFVLGGGTDKGLLQGLVLPWTRFTAMFTSSFNECINGNWEDVASQYLVFAAVVAYEIANTTDFDELETEELFIEKLDTDDVATLERSPSRDTKIMISRIGATVQTIMQVGRQDEDWKVGEVSVPVKHASGMIRWGGIVGAFLRILKYTKTSLEDLY